jgi:hypothetical protein
VYCVYVHSPTSSPTTAGFAIISLRKRRGATVGGVVKLGVEEGSGVAVGKGVGERVGVVVGGGE